MRNVLLGLIILLVNLAVFSQTSKKSWSDEVAFSDGTTIASESVINKENIQISADDINIYKKVFQGRLLDIGKSPLRVSKNALAAISKKNGLIARRIKQQINGYYSFEQSGKEITVFGLNSVKNQGALAECVRSQNCKLECAATIIQLKIKDKTENLILITAAKLLKN